MEERAAGQFGDGLLAGVDQIQVDGIVSGRRAHAQDAVFAMQHDLAAGGKMGGHQHWHADAQVDVGAFRDVLRDAGGDLVAGQFGAHCCSLASICTTRCTKMPGVTTVSGSSVPSSTTSRTCATATRAALAMMGPKLRAVLR
ncbi:hypothetical protein G6F66_013904 [Rhizopus arrhizus]|nr:hypothetical protein G6F66_013904 [Rhizopus arrhizus]